MDKALLIDIKNKMFIRSSMLSLPNLDEILGLNDYLSPDEVFLEIIKKSLREFELSLPLVIDMKISCGQLGVAEGMDGYSEILSNFHLYLDGIISEGQIILVPNVTPKWRSGTVSYPSAGNYTYFTDYHRPFVFLENIPTNDIFYIRGICSRPIISDFTTEKLFNPDNDKSAVYWMNIEEGAKGYYFMDLCMMNLLDYIRQMKASLLLPNTSIDILGNVDNAYMELRGRCEQFVLQSSWYGDVLM